MQCWRFHFRLSRPGWGSYLGSPVNEPCPFQQLPRGWVHVPRQGHPSGGQEGQRGCREALPPRRPREPGEEGRRLPPQPRNWSWKLRWRWVIRWSTPSISLVCFGEVRLGKGSNRPTWVLTVWHHPIAVEALETFILLPWICVYEPGSGL